MTLEIAIVFIIILGALILFVSDVVPVDLTAILVMTSLMITGILSPEQAVSGFSNAATITILGLLIIGEGLKNTGAVERLADQVLRFAGEKEWITLVCVMCIAAFTSAFINTTAVVAVFIPVVFQVAKSKDIHPAVMLIPLSFAAMVGGSSTMIGTSTNLLISALAVDNGLPAFAIFKPTLLGVLLLGIVIVYMVTIGRHVLRPERPTVQVLDSQVDPKHYLTEIVIPENSNYIGQRLIDTGLIADPDFRILALTRDDLKYEDPNPNWVLRKGDTLIIKTDAKHIVKVNADDDLRIATNTLPRNRGIQENEYEPELFEVLISANSSLLDQRIEDVDFDSFYDARPLAVKKIRVKSPEQLVQHKISYGDILLMSGKSHQTDKDAITDWINIQQFSPEVIRQQLPKEDRLWVSLAIIAGVVLFAVLGILPILVSAWAGVSLMFLTGCLTLKKAYNNVEWKVIFLLAGIIPLGSALTTTGADQFIASGLLHLTGDATLRVLVAIFFAITVVLTGIISNQATAVLLIPIAFYLSQSLGISAEALVMTILFGASASFLTPVGYQTNAMIYGPGNYKFMDFIKVGGPLSFVFWIVVTIFVPMMYG